MASPTDAAPAASEEKPASPVVGEEKGLSPKMFFILIGVQVLVLAAIGAALVFFVLPGQLTKVSAPAATAITPPAEEVKTEKKEDSSKKEGEKKEGDKKDVSNKAVSEFVLDQLLVNISGTRGNRFLKVSLFFEAPAEVLTELNDKRPLVTDLVSQALSNKSIDELSAPTARGTLRTELLGTVNAALKEGKVDNIYFTDFIIQ